jgi:hypothetical protein
VFRVGGGPPVGSLVCRWVDHAGDHDLESLVTKENALLIAQLAYDTTRLRLDAGAHPDDAVFSGFSILQAWVYTTIDGEWPQYKEKT